MAGVDARTGRPIEGDARIAQAILRLILTQHDLLMRRHLACDLPDIVGTPNNAIERFAYQAAVATALAGPQGERRLDLREVRFLDEAEVDGIVPEGRESADGQAWLRIAGYSRETGRPIEIAELVA